MNRHNTSHFYFVYFIASVLRRLCALHFPSLMFNPRSSLPLAAFHLWTAANKFLDFLHPWHIFPLLTLTSTSILPSIEILLTTSWEKRIMGQHSNEPFNIYHYTSKSQSLLKSKLLFSTAKKNICLYPF